jgi:hypothetical protein
MSKKIDKGARKWLNPHRHDDTGMFSWFVEYESDLEEHYPTDWVDASLDVWDCSRKASLNFGFSNEKQAKQRAEKIDMLITALQDMKKAMAEAYQAIQEDGVWEERKQSDD